MPKHLPPLLAFAVAVSVVHYTDNYVDYAAYPVSGTLPNPSATTVLLSWFAFTAFAVAAVLLLRRGEIRAGALALAAYSGSGLVGIGHYTVAGATDLVWWRQAHIVLDIACGFALLATAISLARRPAPRSPRASADPAAR